jgi:hypothetical protein
MQEQESKSYWTTCLGVSIFFGFLLGLIFYVTASATQAASLTLLAITSGALALLVCMTVLGTLLGWNMTGRPKSKRT